MIQNVSVCCLFLWDPKSPNIEFLLQAESPRVGSPSQYVHMPLQNATVFHLGKPPTDLPKHKGNSVMNVSLKPLHICSMGLEYLPHEWLEFMVNVGKYSIHEASGYLNGTKTLKKILENCNFPRCSRWSLFFGKHYWTNMSSKYPFESEDRWKNTTLHEARALCRMLDDYRELFHGQWNVNMAHP